MASCGEDRRLLTIQNEILEMIAYGEPLETVADTLCRRIEDIAPQVFCSVLTVDGEGRIHPVAAPRLPAEYSSALDGVPIGPKAGSCGTAAYRGEPVVVEDILADPLWDDYKALAEPIGLRACWSSPIKARGGRVIGTFALYYRSKRGPSAVERNAVDTCVHLCAIAIEQAEIQTRNRRLAYFDTLTGLPNRFHADVLLKRKLESAPDDLGLLLIDIDNLKITNDTLGHAVGDELIRQVASRIADTVRPGMACRIGGDEFIVILEGCQSPTALETTAKQVLASIAPPFEFDAHTIFPHATIGGVVYGRDGTDIDTLRQNADFALYHSKEIGRGGFVGFSQDLRTSMTRRVQQVRELEAALSEGRISAHYQPIVRLDSGEIVGLEALARLVRPDGEVTRAADFQHACKEPRAARRLTDEMLKQVAADTRAWIDRGLTPPSNIGINVTTADFEDGGLAGRILSAFETCNVPLKGLMIEVTESVLVGNGDTRIIGALDYLRSKGIRVALDDFGTGYASLTHLLTFPVDTLKIDKCFVDHLAQDDASCVIVSALVDIAGRLGMRIVAEGIETAEQAARLKELGCTLGQGFAYYRPADFAETTARLRDNAQHMAERARNAA